MALVHNTNIVRSGLVLYLDAANRKSYPGTGTTWTDLSGQGNNGTLGASTASPTFNSFNGGSFTWDNGDIVTVPMSNLRPTSGITQEVWVYITNNVLQVFLGSQYGASSNNSYALWFENSYTLAGGVNISGSLNFQSQNLSISTNNWYYFVHTYDGSNQRLYSNGIQVRSWATTGSITYDTNNTLLAVGNDWNGSGYNAGASIGIRGRLSNIKIYNRALTAQEILQNFEATRDRYGI